MLRLGPDDLDADRFTNAVDAGRDELAGGDARAAVDVLRDALARWRGPACDGFGFEEWLQAEVAGLDERRAVAEENLIDGLLASGLAADAVTHLQELIDEYPLRDRFRAQLMLARYRTGRQAEALRSFQDYRQGLIDVALEPSEELAALDRAITMQDPALQLAAPAGRPVRRYRLSDEIGSGSHGVVYRAVLVPMSQGGRYAARPR